MFKQIKVYKDYDYFIDITVTENNKELDISDYVFNGYVTDEVFLFNQINKLAEFSFEFLDEFTVRCHLSKNDLTFFKGKYKYLIDYTDTDNKKSIALNGDFTVKDIYE